MLPRTMMEEEVDHQPSTYCNHRFVARRFRSESPHRAFTDNHTSHVSCFEYTAVFVPVTRVASRCTNAGIVPPSAGSNVDGVTGPQPNAFDAEAAVAAPVS